MKFLFESSQTAAEVVFQLRANYDGCNCIDFVDQELEDVDLSGIIYVVDSLGGQFCPEGTFCFCCYLDGKLVSLPFPKSERLEKSLSVNFFEVDESGDEELAKRLVDSMNQEVNPTYYADEISEIARQFAELSE